MRAFIVVAAREWYCEKDVRPHNFKVIKEANWDVKLMDFGSVNTYTKDNSGRHNVNFYLEPECYDVNFLPESDMSCGTEHII